MTPELDAKLCETYPKLFAQRHHPMRQTCMCWGFECGDGWYNLLDSLCSHLQFHIDHNGDPQVEVTQVKEKFGSLRFYTTATNKRQDGIISFAEVLSGSICEECGNPGTSNDSGWIKVRCDLHKDSK